MTKCKQCGKEFEYGELELKVGLDKSLEYSGYCSDFCLSIKYYENWGDNVKL